MPPSRILVLGAGELGSAIIRSILSHPNYEAEETPVTLLVRPATMTSPDRQKAAQLHTFREEGITLLAGDLEHDSAEYLTSLFRAFRTVIHAGAMYSQPGTQLKVTQAAVNAGVEEFIPWQWGVDYDAITRQGGQGMFNEQLDVRDLLRSQSRTKWLIVSCGIFMSFLFSDSWGVIERDARGTGQVSTVRALGGWDHLLTATTAEDIARCTAELILVDTTERDKCVYIAGDTTSYGEFADTIASLIKNELHRDVWTTDYLREESQKDPADKLKKYRVVFSEDQGLAWPKETTYNAGKKIEMEGFRSWFSKNYQSQQ